MEFRISPKDKQKSQREDIWLAGLTMFLMILPYIYYGLTS